MGSVQPVRQRKRHKKSRAGCANCKLRRGEEPSCSLIYQCDETRPQCKKCLEYRVACSYEAKEAKEVDLHGTGSFQVVSFKPAMSTHESMLSMIYENHLSTPSVLETSHRFDLSDLDTLYKFQHRTVQTMGTPKISGILRNELVRAACQDAPLMHALLSITLAHDRVQMSPFAKPTLREVYHVNQSIQAVSKAIRDINNPLVSDKIWATATIMGAVSFCTIDSQDPEDLWPNQDTDLAWLRMSEGKSIVHKMMSTAEPNSPSFELAVLHHQSTLKVSIPFEDLAVLPQKYLDVFDIDQKSNTDNPYYTSICFIAQLWNLEANQTNVLYYSNFLTRMDPAFRRLLLAKDPRALLAIVWWWSMAAGFKQWWHQTRARLEGQAVCLYLGKNYSHEWYIQEFLPFAQVGLSMTPERSLDVRVALNSRKAARIVSV